MGGTKMKEKVPLIGRRWLRDDFKNLVDRQIRKQRCNERLLAEQCTTKHQLEARKSCVVDARNYRIARKFPISGAAKLDWKNLIHVRRPNMFQSAWLKKFPGDQLKHWLTAKQAG
jgi:hypothetical protein